MSLRPHRWSDISAPVFCESVNPVLMDLMGSEISILLNLLATVKFIFFFIFIWKSLISLFFWLVFFLQCILVRPTAFISTHELCSHTHRATAQMAVNTPMDLLPLWKLSLSHPHTHTLPSFTTLSFRSSLYSRPLSSYAAFTFYICTVVCFSHPLPLENL